MGSILSMQWPISPAGRKRQLPPAMHAAAGAIHQMRGRLAVVQGTFFHNDIMRARGHRQELVGLLQRFWKRDRRSVERWVDALLTRDFMPPALPAARRRASRGRSGTPLLHQET